MNWPEYEKELPVWVLLPLVIIGVLFMLCVVVGMLFALYMCSALALGALAGAFVGAFHYVSHLF